MNWIPEKNEKVVTTQDLSFKAYPDALQSHMTKVPKGTFGSIIIPNSPKGKHFVQFFYPANNMGECITLGRFQVDISSLTPAFPKPPLGNPDYAKTYAKDILSGMADGSPTPWGDLNLATAFLNLLPLLPTGHTKLPCNACNGTGRVRDLVSLRHHTMATISCQACLGKGHLPIDCQNQSSSTEPNKESSEDVYAWNRRFPVGTAVEWTHPSELIPRRGKTSCPMYLEKYGGNHPSVKVSSADPDMSFIVRKDWITCTDTTEMESATQCRHGKQPQYCEICQLRSDLLLARLQWNALEKAVTINCPQDAETIIEAAIKRAREDHAQGEAPDSLKHALPTQEPPKVASQPSTPQNDLPDPSTDSLKAYWDDVETSAKDLYVLLSNQDTRLKILELAQTIATLQNSQAKEDRQRFADECSKPMVFTTISKPSELAEGMHVRAVLDGENGNGQHLVSGKVALTSGCLMNTHVWTLAETNSKKQHLLADQGIPSDRFYNDVRSVVEIHEIQVGEPPIL